MRNMMFHTMGGHGFGRHAFAPRGGFGPGGAGFGPGFGPGGPGFGPGGPGFGPGGPGFGPRGWRGARGRARGWRGRGGRGGRGRGNVRAAVLALLAEEPRHGYSIMNELGERSGGLWRPSPGSVYPVLQQLQDEGLVASTDSDGRKVFDLTDEGRRYVEDHAEELNEPWHVSGHGPPERGLSLMHSGTTLAAAVQQVARVGTDEQAAQAAAVLDDARQSIYR